MNEYIKDFDAYYIGDCINEISNIIHIGLQDLYYNNFMCPKCSDKIETIYYAYNKEYSDGIFESVFQCLHCHSYIVINMVHTGNDNITYEIEYDNIDFVNFKNFKLKD